MVTKPTMMSTSGEDVLTLPEVAVYLKIPRTTVYKLVHQNKLPGHKVGKQWRCSAPHFASGQELSPAA